MKRIAGIYSAPRAHWVGDGFPVRSLFSYHSHGAELSPFLLLDYAGPAHFPAAERPRGVGEHPHRGFETVTIVYQGEVAHRDSTGKGGVIGPGDVQWMTAGAGILHEEFHSEAFTRSGGDLEMVQLWVNLPARDKMTPPGYQAIASGAIPDIALDHGAGRLRLIAGDFAGRQGPARTFSPMQVWDLRLKRDGYQEFSLPAGWTTALVVLKGAVLINGQSLAREAQLVLFEPDGEQISLEANDEATLLLLSGKPLGDPVVGYGPFVMTSEAEIRQAIDDFNSGRFGAMS
ncbi:pirin family protein [Zobellella sp. An-6]|uniref:pirin family protein n=1 Tax=Zobellella sp. An-6 TaxID=3400218 RepID=UPI004041A431